MTYIRKRAIAFAAIVLVFLIITPNITGTNLVDKDTSSKTSKSFTDSSSSGDIFWDTNDGYGYSPAINAGIEVIESNNMSFAVTNWGAYGVSYYDRESYGLYYNIAVMNEPDHYQGSYGYTDSPGEPYTNIGTNPFEIECGIDTPISIPSTTDDITLSFWSHWNIEEDFDGVQVFVSDDGGSNWDEIIYPDMNLCTQSGGKQQVGSYYYDGTKGGYKEFHRQPTSTGDTGNLNAYRGENILFKFWFGADEYTEIEPEYDGFYIDNINIYRGSNESNQIWSLNFESVLPVNWFKDNPWDKTVATPSAGNLCSFGQFLVGINSGYVAKDNYLDTTVDDWTAICDWNNDVGQNCFFQNTQNTSLANLEVREYCYTDLNTPHISNEDYIIVDVYVENIGSTTLTNIYPGIQFDLQVVAPPDYNIYNDMVSANYSSSHPLIWFYDEGKSDDLCVGVSLLGAGLVGSAYNDNLHSAKYTQISTIYYFIDNSILWNNLSISGTETPPSFAGNHAFVMSTHISSLGVGETYRFCFAVIGGDSSTDIQTNSDIAYLEFQDIEVDPKVSIVNTSLGKIKSIFME